MIRFLLVSLVIGFLIGATPVVQKPAHAGHLMPAAQVERLLEAAAKYSRYDKPWFARPQVWVMTPEEFAQDVCGDPDPNTCNALGATSREWPYEVMIRSPAAPDQMPEYFQSVDRVSVHELIHWLQDMNGYGLPPGEKSSNDVSCAMLQAGEAEAYAGAYRYATEVEGVSQGFFIAQTYEGCVTWKLMNGRGSH